MRVPIAVGDYLILDAVRESGGTCITVADREMVEIDAEDRRRDGHLALPGGCRHGRRGAQLRESGWLRRTIKVVCFFTSGGLKHLDLAVIPTGPVLTPGDP